MIKENETKYWGPRPEALDYVASLIADGAKVLEVGPGNVPFSKATTFIDHVPGDNVVVLDVESEPLPFPDKHFDFVYCRHVVEDIVYPFDFLKEMSRVGKAGFVETPSVAAEICRGIDGKLNGNNPPWRGYNHHHWFVWNHEGKLKLLKKYPYVEYLQFNEELIEATLRSNPSYWNTYLLWKDTLDFERVVTGVVCPEYPEAITIAVVQGVQTTTQFLDASRGR